MADGVQTALGDLLEEVRGRRPLVHHITNFVVMELTANVTIHVGGSPIMAHAVQEVEDVVSHAACLVLNMGTADATRGQAMLLAGRRANALGIPVVLDPVGYGLTPFRTQMVDDLLAAVKVHVIRGNAAEVGRLVGAGGVLRGVDSAEPPADCPGVARAAAARYGAVVALCGEEDFVTDGCRSFRVRNGHRYLTQLTGTGCAATATLACFVGARARSSSVPGSPADYLLSVVAALTFYGVAAEIAAQRPDVQGPASFKVAFHDTLATLPRATFQSAALVEQLAGDAAE